MQSVRDISDDTSGVPLIGIKEAEPPLREELFSSGQLESHARSLATTQILDTGKGPELLLRRLNENAEIIKKSYEDVAKALSQNRSVSPGAEWLLDNYYLIEEQIDHIRLNFPPQYSQQLPRLGTGHRKGLPRLYDLALELVSHTDGRVDIENISLFLQAFQSVHPLKIGELWAMPLMIDLALMENLRRVSYRISWRRMHCSLALEWSQRFIQIIQKKPKSLIMVLAEFIHSNPPIVAPFLAELTAELQGRHPSLGLVINWIEQELAERGQTLEIIQQAESQDQAADQVSIGNSITSLRNLRTIDWKNFVESLSIIESTLQKDPCNIYAKMDFHSRDICRHQVEELARGCDCEEETVAAAAIKLAEEKARSVENEQREKTVSYFLIGDGREKLEKRIGYKPSFGKQICRNLKKTALPVYLLSLTVLTILITAVFLKFVDLSSVILPIVGLISVVIVASRSALSIINWLVTLIVPPCNMLKLDFSKGIPDEHRTAVVIPTLLSSMQTVEKLIEQQEVRYLANRDNNLLMILLTDFPDAPKETMAEDEHLLKSAIDGIQRLNRKYSGNGHTPFYILNRPRQYNESQGCWMGYERKRGKLSQLNHLIKTGNSKPFTTIEGNIEELRSVRNIIVLDSDTSLPPQSALKMAATLAHPINQPHIDPEHNRVDRGYGMLQPRLATNLSNSRQSLFARLFAGDVGIDPYTREVSNIYQDLFGHSQFIGKGIYDVQTFDAVLSKRFPENRILSHDLIEGCYNRCGFLNTVELVEEHPTHYLADVSRRFRWARGDWQIARWLLSRVPDANGKTYKNPLGILCKWMIFDNLRRTIVPLAFLAAFFIGCFLPVDASLGWMISLITVFFLPDLLKSIHALAFKPKHLRWATHTQHATRKESRIWAIDILDLIQIPFISYVYLKAIFLTTWRLLFSRKYMLQWQTSSDAEQKADNTLTGICRAMWIAPFAAAIIAFTIALIKTPALAELSNQFNIHQYPGGIDGLVIEAVLLVEWFLSPLIFWRLSRPTTPVEQEMTKKQKLFLRKTARRTWSFFDEFVNEENNWLPPDNFQEEHSIGQAHRTSPTNIGMALASNLAACDFGYISERKLIENVSNTFKTLEELPRYHGHFYNWYDTRTLHAFHPRYISTADSGNLTGSLIALRGGLEELINKPILSEKWLEGLNDTTQILFDELQAELKNKRSRLGNSEINRIQKEISLQIKSLQSLFALSEINSGLSSLGLIVTEFESLVPQNSESHFWIRTLRNQCRDIQNDIVYMAPWLELEDSTQTNPKNKRFENEIPTLFTLANLKSDSSTNVNSEELACKRATERIKVLEDLQYRCRELSETDVSFLYDPSHRLLSIGYNLETNQRDPGYYDLLASEARLCSFLGVVLGQLPIDHWFCLGRQLVPIGKNKVLISWSGSMFEYLMPLLFMPSYEATLLHESYNQAVQCQINHGLRYSVPWGISESCFNQIDINKVYQYRGFGVVGMGLKRGLKDDLVIAPYATALAMMVKPVHACRNLQKMDELGFQGRYGFYEAIDYTRNRVPHEKSFAVVRSYMSHHSGMSFLALNNALMGGLMQKRFQSDPRINASLLLLQERVPVVEVHSRVGVASEKHEKNGQAEPPVAALRTFTRADMPVPDVHLLSNGRYHVLITSAGSGSSRWENLSLTRWQEDATKDNWGTFLYIRDVDTGEYWSATAQPCGKEPDRYDVTFSQGAAEFQLIKNKVKAQTRVAVSPEDDVELRRLSITNLAGHSRNLEITSFSEVVLLDGIDAGEQPAFQGLFVQTELIRDKDAVLSFRRPKSPDEKWPVFFHGMTVHDGESKKVSFETDRCRFIGRCQTNEYPAAMKKSGKLSDTCGAVLDPVMSVRHKIHLGPGQSITLDAIWGLEQNSTKALSLIDKYYDRHLADRVFELAWTNSQVMLHQLQIKEADSQLFSQLAGLLIYANPHLRARASLIARNRKGQSDLWAYGISGDLPIVLLRVSDLSGLDLVLQVIKAHAYWRCKGLKTDLVILCEAYSGYRQTLMDAIIGLINVNLEAKALNQPAGIFVRNMDQVTEDDRMLLKAVSRIVLSDRVGTLSEHLDRYTLPQPDQPIFKPSRNAEEMTPQEKQLPERELAYFNSWGGFTPDGREYVTMIKPGVVTPAPWVNVLANPNFGSVVSESGSAYTWFKNAHEFRLTPWYNDAVSDISGEAFYIRDEETGRFWSPMPWPVNNQGSYVSRHGLGYSAFEHTEDDIFSETFTYTAAQLPIKLTNITLRNLSNRKRKLSLTGFVEWVLGESRARNSMNVVTRLDAQTGAIFACNTYKADFNTCVGFFNCSHMLRTLTTSRTEFIGRNGSLSSPEAMRRVNLSNQVGAGTDPCAAIQTFVEIPPGEQVQLVFMLGGADNEQHARSILAQSSGVDGARHILEEVWDKWKRDLGRVYVETPDLSVDLLVNHWLLYQTLGCRVWGRSGFYQSGGAFGFRDQLQDSLAFLYECPWITRDQILLCASRQFIEGDVQHWWHPPTGRGVRTQISDDYLWLVYVTCRYIKATGDTGILDEQVSFLEAAQLEPGEESHYGMPQVSEKSGSIYEHCVCAINHAINYGAHGLPLIGAGDWNDGMNRVGCEGKGESVWLGFFIYDILHSFTDIAKLREDNDLVKKCQDEAAKLQQNIDQNAWDGEWYLRAFFDDGSPLGSSVNSQCSIDLLPQTWSILTGATDPARSKQALESALKRLIDPKTRTIHLLDPPFDGTEMDPGYIRAYIPGVRENGGQYTHAAIWAAIAVARSRKIEQAWELFTMLNPIKRSASAETASVYKVEPYVMPADIYSTPGHEGRGGWTWYTGSAGWMYQFTVEHLLGLKVEANTLSFSPLIPEQWNEYTLHYCYRNTFFHIRIIQTGSDTWNTRSVMVDNNKQHDNKIHLFDDGNEHYAVVEVGLNP
ncbi:MAG: GH36-type glycosyl hydrolase domain-containing protein [Sedimentisphaeraceae bacterium JB056]